VDLFFVLSGFLIGGILLDSRDSPNFFKQFYVRRFFRIVPIYAVVLCLVCVFAERSGITKMPYMQTGPWYLYLLFLQNFWMAKSNALGLLGVTWSLAVEEQFYLTLPAVIRFSGRRLPYVIVTGILVAPILRVALFYAYPTCPFAPRALMPCRADALLLGVIGAILVRNEKSLQKLREHKASLWCALVVLLVGTGIMTLHPHWTYGIQMASFGFSWLAVLYLCLLLLAVTQPQTWLGACLRFGPLRWLGTIAYGTYLIL
jgi:peptidoglycan/LPS O-acetylase OafA/YrhL